MKLFSQVENISTPRGDPRVYRNDCPCKDCEQEKHCETTGEACKAFYKYIANDRSKKKWERIPSYTWRTRADNSVT